MRSVTPARSCPFDNVSFVEAAALPVGLATEHDALVTLGGFKPGSSVLIVGGTSSVGLIGIQLAKALGAGKVIATTTSDSKRSALIEAGADLTVNTSLEDLVSVVRDATDGKGVDITLDHLGGELFAQLPSATRIGGTIVNIGRLAGAVAEFNLDEVSFRRLRVIGTTFSCRTADELAAVTAALAPQILPAVGAGLIKARIDRTYPIESFSDAAERMRGGSSRKDRLLLRKCQRPFVASGEATYRNVNHPSAAGPGRMRSLRVFRAQRSSRKSIVFPGSHQSEI